jgi:predicted CXXCH cytochrome family protein
MKSLTTNLLTLGAVGLLAAAVFAQGGASVVQTKHNLSASGPGPIRVAGTQGVCIFCHTPHAANPIGPLWNRRDPGTYYQVYRSSTLTATVGQPTGTSRMCLSCHDGTIALTQTYNSNNALPGSVYITPQDRGYIGTDLTDDHPISFTYDSALAAKNTQLRDPASIPKALELDQNHQLQCTTCHDPHNDSRGYFLRMDNRASAMCASCHNMTGWPQSGHSRSGASVAAIKVGHWDNLPKDNTVADLGCEACHRPHTAGGRERLLRYDAEEDNCLVCHNGTVGKDVNSDLSKLSRHPVRSTIRIHSPVENALTMQVHVECADCHNPHEALAGVSPGAPRIKPAMKGATGQTAFGQGAIEATNEYEVCYKCHASRNPAKSVVDRVIPDNDIAWAFNPTNPGFHPVQVIGKNTAVPSLVQNLFATSIIYCTDCHGSDTPTRALGPHGSAFRPLLVRNYTTTDNTPESAQAYDLCYGCHTRTSILGDQSFSKHHTHISDKRAPCSVCHDAHGVQQQPHLINFDRFVVKPRTNGAGPTYTSTGSRRGSCTLLCHGEDHNNETYGP